MKYLDVSREISEQIHRELPHTLSYLEGVDYKLQQLGAGLIIRDSDHRWGSLRLEFRGNLDFEQQRKIGEQIKNYTESHCSLCGATERVYDGDVLLAEDKNGRRFWGMVKLAEWLGHKWKAHDSPSPLWRNFFLVHGWGNFDSPLMMATKFKIVGRVCDIANFDGSDASDGHYMVWCEENKSMDLDNIPL